MLGQECTGGWQAGGRRANSAWQCVLVPLRLFRCLTILFVRSRARFGGRLSQSIYRAKARRGRGRASTAAKRDAMALASPFAKVAPHRLQMRLIYIKSA